MGSGLRSSMRQARTAEGYAGLIFRRAAVCEKSRRSGPDWQSAATGQFGAQGVPSRTGRLHALPGAGAPLATFVNDADMLGHQPGG